LTASTGALRAWASAAVIGALACGCRGGRAAEARPAAEPSALQSQPGTAEARPDAGDALSATEGLPKLTPVLDDPRLAAARSREDAGDEAAAAREVERVSATVSLDPRRTCEWTYLAGRLHLAAGEVTEAALAFERVAAARDPDGAPCSLAPYARLREAQALVRAGDDAQAIACAQAEQAAGDDAPIRDETNLALADAFAGKGDRAAAVPLWRALLVANPHGVRWVDLSIQLATALLDGVDGPAATHAQEALDRATRVFIEAPVSADKHEIEALRSRAATALKRRVPALTPEEQVRQAQAWLDASQPKRARDAAEALPRESPHSDEAHHAAACSAAIVRAKATPHGKAESAADAWGTAIARCRGDEALATALYYGAKASTSAHRNAEALSRFERVEKLFPKHRLADDARLRGAMIREDEGDEVRSLAMLSSLADDYPDGDMRGEALFRVALVKLERLDLDGARAALDRMLAVEPASAGAASAGRGAAGRGDYFRARVAELAGDAEDAKRRYAALIESEPLDYYMVLAYARLRALDDGLARSTLAGAVSREPAGPFLTRDHAEFASAVFDRFLTLLDVGEVDAARREAIAAGLLAEGEDSEVLWTLAWLYDRAGAPDLGHAFSRGRLVDYRAHWPAGRWRLAWETAYPRAWDTIVSRESEATHLSPALTWAVMREESAFNQDAQSPVNAIGLMQLMSGTARIVAKDTLLPSDDQALHRPDVSIALGARLLSSLRVSFPSHPALAIAAYNSGAGAVRRWLSARGADALDVFVERIPFDETRAYVKRVLASAAAYAYLYAPAGLDELLAVPARTAPMDAVASP
jgi:soluble lytic murein transglycosylase